MSHTFHIPVLGLGFSIDTPLKVARYGISSVVSIVDDELVERMRRYHTPAGRQFHPITETEPDHRAKRITAYLNLLHELVIEQHHELKYQPFLSGSDICRYFELLPEHSANKKKYLEMLAENDLVARYHIQEKLRHVIQKGAIDVNIMAKVDKINFSRDGESLGDRFTDALAALRGFAQSDLTSSLVLSAGMNPRLYSYLQEFPDFLPVNGKPAKKKIILKVSDYRSASIQAQFLAKKGIWVSGFRIESGLNCGGHAFATEGFLLGPILEEFKEKRASMLETLFDLYQKALAANGFTDIVQPKTTITAQGGIGTAEEDAFLRTHYQLDGTGWGSAFLLVPEATNVDDDTLSSLSSATPDDFYLSNASPLGIPFNNFRHSGSEKQRLERIQKGKPGSSCTKKFLVSNTEFSETPICTASRQYQNLKIASLRKSNLPVDDLKAAVAKVTEKICLCQGLCAAAYLKYKIAKPKENTAVAICPGPNTAYFKGPYTLDSMVSHIYQRMDLLAGVARENMFVNELKLYVNYLKNDIAENLHSLNTKKAKQLAAFKEQLQQGMAYYFKLVTDLPFGEKMYAALTQYEKVVEELSIPSVETV